jgi:hypothetical protein
VTGRVDEFLELAIGNRRAVDPEVAYRDAMHRRFFRIMPVGPHAERTAGNPDHALGVGIARPGVVVTAQVDL